MQESCWYYYICVVELSIPRKNLQRCGSFSHRKFFKPNYSLWLRRVRLEICQEKWADSVRGHRLDWEWGGRWLDLPPMMPPEPPGALAWGVPKCYCADCEYAIYWGFSRDTCGGSVPSFLACQPDFTEFLKNSPLREVHDCSDIWDRKYLPCNLYIRGLIAGDKQNIFICLHVSIWDGA